MECIHNLPVDKLIGEISPETLRQSATIQPRMALVLSHQAGNGPEPEVRESEDVAG
jgi:hypothetical protein